GTVDTIRIEYANPNQPTTIQDYGWKGSVRLAGGVFFTPVEKWTFRMGLAWDQSPVPDRTRTPRLPDSDRVWLAAGFTYRINKACAVHVSYFHLFIDRTSIDLTETGAGNLQGDVKGRVDAVSIGFTGTF
ncbi:MAG: OmpP1/FadL family transporter, partial [Planctomycetota bacterium]